jgi:hypothetical protein
LPDQLQQDRHGIGNVIVRLFFGIDWFFIIVVAILVRGPLGRRWLSLDGLFQ